MPVNACLGHGHGLASSSAGPDPGPAGPPAPVTGRRKSRKHWQAEPERFRLDDSDGAATHSHSSVFSNKAEATWICQGQPGPVRSRSHASPLLTHPGCRLAKVGHDKPSHNRAALHRPGHRSGRARARGLSLAGGPGGGLTGHVKPLIARQPVLVLHRRVRPLCVCVCARVCVRACACVSVRVLNEHIYTHTRLGGRGRTRRTDETRNMSGREEACPD